MYIQSTYEWMVLLISMDVPWVMMMMMKIACLLVEVWCGGISTATKHTHTHLSSHIDKCHHCQQNHNNLQIWKSKPLSPKSD